MSKKKLVTTPLTNTIWWATVNEEKELITGNREDVTDNAIQAVTDHLIGQDSFDEKGFAGYEYDKKDGGKITICAFDDRYIAITKDLYDELKGYKYKAMYEDLNK